MSSSKSKAKVSNGSWSLNSGVATWSAGTLTPNSSYELTVPSAATSFSVATPTSRTKEFSLTATLTQLGSGPNFSTFKGSALSKDKFRIVGPSGSPGVVTDEMFGNFSSVEEIALKGSGGFSVTLAAKAQAAGIKEVEGSDAADRIDASAFTAARSIELEGERGNDTLIGGQGNDKIEGGKGADQIDLTAGGSDRVKYESRTDGSAEGVAGQSFAGYDVISGFVSGDDKIDIDYDFSAIRFIDVANPPGISLTSVDQVLQAMNGKIVGDATLRAGGTVIFAINDGVGSAVYSAKVIDSNLATPELEALASNPFMLATVNTTLAAGDII